VNEGIYLVALSYIEGEALDLSNHAYFSVQRTANLDFPFANVQWFCHFKVPLKFSNFTFKPYIHYIYNEHNTTVFRLRVVNNIFTSTDENDTGEK